ncbi:unnamed protein product [marine sediment metagenome]|uniref:DUF91 domain-containing protein n=1 Tax=marine sediment metagenome TaxID=412755 RepID=X1HDU0_9ZZZZ
MPTLGVSQKPIVMPRYAHMMELDRDVWTRFLESGDFAIAEVWYDVHVGEGLRLPAEAPVLDQKISSALYEKRVDCVCRVGSELWVVEVKPKADMTALGQIITYRELFLRKYRPRERVLGVVVCDQVDEDLLDLFGAVGVVVISNEYSEF